MDYDKHNVCSNCDIRIPDGDTRFTVFRTTCTEPGFDAVCTICNSCWHTMENAKAMVKNFLGMFEKALKEIAETKH